MAFIDGEHGENFMTVLGLPLFGDVDTNFTTKLSNNTGTFPKIWESKEPTIDKYVMQKLIELEQEIKELKKELALSTRN